MTTTAHKIAMLEKYGFTIGDRDSRLNTDHAGEFMVVEANAHDIDDYDLPTKDGSNGPWCIVGDDLDALVDEAHSYLMAMADDHNDIDRIWSEVEVLPEEDLPARSFTSLEAPAPTA